MFEFSAFWKSAKMNCVSNMAGLQFILCSQNWEPKWGGIVLGCFDSSRYCGMLESCQGEPYSFHAFAWGYLLRIYLAGLLLIRLSSGRKRVSSPGWKDFCEHPLGANVTVHWNPCVWKETDRSNWGPSRSYAMSVDFYLIYVDERWGY